MVFVSLTLLICGAIFSFSNESLFSSGQHAMGYFAFGQFACGVFAAGQFAVGVFAVGIFSFGVFSLGIFNIGLYAVGIYILGKKYSKKKSIDVLQLVKWKFKPTVILGLLIVASYSDAQAQLVNGDFEAWSDQGAYWSPNGFASPNALSQNGYYAVTRSEDHPVSSEGMYSARIESKASMLPAANAYGLILQNPNQNFLEGIKLSPAATPYITGFGLTDATGYATSPQVTGTVYAADMVPPTNTNLTTAVENMITAYNDAAGRPTPDFSELGTGNIGGDITSWSL